MGKKKGGKKKEDEPGEAPEATPAEDGDEREFADNYPTAMPTSEAAAGSSAGEGAVDVSDEAAVTAGAAKLAIGSGGGDEPTISLSDTLVVTGTSSTRHIPSVPYCEVSSLPFEYCEFSPLFAKCKESFEKNWRTHFPQVDDTEEALAELMARLGFTGGDAASKKAQSSGKKAAPADGDAPAPPMSKKEKKAKEPSEIVIELNNRNKKKHITTIKGLEAFGVDTAAAAKVFGKRFACGSALKKGQNGQPDQIEIQGSCRDELPGVLVDKLKMSLDNIFILIDGKKTKATSEAS